MHRELSLAWGLARRLTLLRRLFVPTVTIRIIRTRARPMAITGRNGLTAVFSLARVRGSTASMDARGITAVLDSMGARASMGMLATMAGPALRLEGAPADLPSVGAVPSAFMARLASTAMDSAAATASMVEAVSAAPVGSMEEADSTAVAAFMAADDGKIK